MTAIRPKQIVRGTFLGRDPLEWRMDGAAIDRAAPLLVALHGYGMNHDVFALLLQKLFALPIRVLIPLAPLAVPDSEKGRSWYDYDGNQDRFAKELVRTNDLLMGFLRSVEQQHDLQPGKRALLGFSQGGYCGSYVALKNSDVFSGMVVSGARVKTEVLKTEILQAAERGFSALLCHGERDKTVEMTAAERSRQALEDNGVAAELRVFDSGHAVGRQQVQFIKEWLRGLFDLAL